MAGKDEENVLEQTAPAKTETPKVETPKVETKVETKSETSKEPSIKRARLGDTDEIPEDADLLELSRSALGKRLQRHTATQLKERFGTADFDDIKKKLDRLGELEAQEEERERASMSERERLEADLNKERQLRTDAERRYNRAVEDRVVDREESRITDIARDLVDPDYIDVLLPKLAKHLKTEYTDAELRTLKDKDIRKWFEGEIEKRPKLAREFEQKAEKKKEVKKVPLSNGARQEGKPSGQQSGQSTAKNFSPNSANAMSPAEARAEARKQGFQW